jgi:signal transduction histidine kinase
VASRLQGRTHAVQIHPALDLAVVRLRHAHGRLVLTVRDDGIGFTPDISRVRSGLGLVTMRERAELAQTALTIRSTERRGPEARIATPVGSQRTLALPVAKTRPPSAARHRRGPATPRRLHIVEEHPR